MSFKNFLKVLLTALFAIALVACSSGDSDDGGNDNGDDDGSSEEATEGGELRVAYSAQPDSLDVHLSTAIIAAEVMGQDRKSTRLNSSHVSISYAVFCLKKKNK